LLLADVLLLLQGLAALYLLVLQVVLFRMDRVVVLVYLLPFFFNFNLSAKADGWLSPIRRFN
jgi:hypothetical protein